MWENWHTHDLSAHEKETCQTVAIGVWAQGRARSAHAVEVSYTGMSVSETETNIEWLRKYKADMIAKGEQEEAEEAQIKERCKGKTQAEFLAETEPCKAGCGKKGRKHLCSQCRMVCKASPIVIVEQTVDRSFDCLDYCDKVCQKEDWQVGTRLRTTHVQSLMSVGSSISWSADPKPLTRSMATRLKCTGL